MDDLSKCLVTWLNTNELSKPCKSLEELSNGILFYELMNSVAPETFDMEGVTLEVKSNWALKLGNLRRLKKSLDRYMEETLKIRFSKFDKIDLPLIARTSNTEELIKLFESILFVIVSCPQKPIFIRRIMDLDESIQIQLMVLIQKVMGESEEAPQESESQKREIEQLRNDKRRVSCKLQEMEQELVLSHEEYAVLHSKFQQLKLENERISMQLIRRSSLEEKENSAIYMELKMKLAEKEEEVLEMRRSVEKGKLKMDAEIAQLKDELDIANSKVFDAINLEKAMQQYKKKVDSLMGVKVQYEDLQKKYDNMMHTFKNQQNELEGLHSLKAALNTMKESLEREKCKMESLNFNLETKEKMIRKLEKDCAEYREKNFFLQQKNEELMVNDYNQESSHVSEDSFAIRYDRELIPSMRERSRYNGGASQFDQIDNAAHELTKVKAQLEIKKTKLKRIKELIKMVNEDCSSRFRELDHQFDTFEKNIVKLQNDNFYLSQEIQKSNEILQEKEHEEFIHTQLMDELELLKNNKISIMSEYKSLLSIKESLNNTIADLNSEKIKLSSLLVLKESQIQDTLTELKAANEQLKAMKENELHQESFSTIKDLPESDKLNKLNKELAALKSEISALNLLVIEKNERINALKNENQMIAMESDRKLMEMKEGYEKEGESRNKDMVRQIEDATSELEKQKELLINRLQSERRNTIMNFHRAMSNKESTSLPSREVFRLRQVLIDKEREICRLNKNNKQLKKCWKDTAKLLKAVWKELGNETKRIEEAVNEDS